MLVVLSVGAVTAQGVNETTQLAQGTEKPVEAKNVSVEVPVVPVIAPRLAVSITKEEAKSDLKKTLSAEPVVLKSGELSLIQ